MKNLRLSSILTALCVTAFVPAEAQDQSQTQPPTVAAKQVGAAVPRLVSFSGVLKDPLGKPVNGLVPVAFSLFSEQEGGTALWSETQTVEPDAGGKYTVFLGATTPPGLPLDLFATAAARWLAVEPGPPAAVEPARILLVGVPYALKAADADTLGGKPASAFLTAPAQSAQSSALPELTVGPDSGVTPAAAPTGGGTTDYVPLWTSSTNLGNSILFQSGSVMEVNGTLELPSVGSAISSTGYDSRPFDLFASVYNSSVPGAVAQHFRWEAEPVSNDTSAASGKLALLYASGTATPAETGLSVSSKGVITFALGQTLPAVAGNETVSGTVSATELISTVAQGTAPLKVTSNTEVANLNANYLGGYPPTAFATVGANAFNGNQVINGVGAVGNYGLIVNQPSQSGILVEGPGAGVGAGLDLQTTGAGFSKGWEILATGNTSAQGLGKFNIRDLNLGRDVLTIDAVDNVHFGGALTLQGNVTDPKINVTSANVIGGYAANAVTNSATGATIAGGGGAAGGSPNTVSDDWGTVGGGSGNTAQRAFATVGGGEGNIASGAASTVPGGSSNVASGAYSIAGGGFGNTAGGQYSFAGGYNATAVDSGSFVWCQSNGAACDSVGANSFEVAVYGPIYFYDGPGGAGCYLSTGAGSWTCSSDRHLKDNIRSIDARSVLERVAQLPILQWSMKADTEGHNHIGPMAQDFFAAFGLGESDKYIAQGDAQGVALASIQGLYQMVQQKLQQKDEEIQALKMQLQALEERISPK